MTFASDLVRLKFHKLPAAKQKEFTDFESSLARSGQTITVHAVVDEEHELEVLISIRSCLEDDSASGI